MFGDPIINPHNWSKVPLGELAEIKIGPFGSLLHKEDYINNGHALVNPSHIKEDKIIVDNSLTVSDEKYEPSLESVGQILCALPGKPMFKPPQRSMIIEMRLSMLRKP